MYVLDAPEAPRCHLSHLPDMTRSPDPVASNSTPTDPPQRPTRPGMAHWHGLSQDRVLQSVSTLCVLLVVYQLALALLRPAWGGTATDWFLSVLAWPELAVAVYLCVRLSHAGRPDAPTWWLVGA